MTLPIVSQAEVRNKRVLVRGDIDAPLQIPNSKSQIPIISDDSRLKTIKPTLDYLLQNGAAVILCGHVGRPNGRIMPELSTKPISEWVSGSVGQQVRVLENLRFDPREEKNDESLAKKLAAMADIYINEAFAASEREHASIVGVPKLLPHFAGFRLAKEVEVLSKVLENPARPLVVVIGGAKIETKQPLIDKMKNFADAVLVAGKLASEDKDTFVNSLPPAKTIIWNGPLGEVETGHEAGTKKLIDLILAQTEAYKIAGGGDTVACLNKLGLTGKFDWVCSGGGSMLKFLAGEQLPGIEALLS